MGWIAEFPDSGRLHNAHSWGSPPGAGGFRVPLFCRAMRNDLATSKSMSLQIVVALSPIPLWSTASPHKCFLEVSPV